MGAESEGSASLDSASALRGTGALVDKINRARLELLDLSTRNRLLNTPRSGRARTVEVVNEIAKAIYQTLVVDGRRFTFAPGRVDPNEEAPEELKEGVEVGDPGDEIVLAEEPTDHSLIEQPDLELDESGRVIRHWDSHLSTRMTSAGLQKRLLDLYIDARTLQEEQGVNILFLAIGYLKWRQTSTPQVDRWAPLILVPVTLERSNAGEKFHLRWSGDEIQANLSLQLFLHREYELKLPDIEDFENLDVESYLAKIAGMVEGKPNWEVLPNDAILGLFSFAKFMMYRDLDPAQWQSAGGMEAIPTLRGVVADGFPGASISRDDGNIDEIITPADMIHVVDCDSSQSLVVHDVRKGNSILVQGPPGTGKSQTIANIVSAAVADGKRVLFVAEKMAALDVVKRRLDNTEIGVACLELHSNKANKKSVLTELQRTWQLGNPTTPQGRLVIEQLTERRDALNKHAERLHQVYQPSNLSPYQVYGQLIRLRRQGYTTQRVALEGATKWLPHEKEALHTLVRDLVQRVEVMGVPDRHPWSGVGNDGLLPNDRDRLVTTISKLLRCLDIWIGDSSALHEALSLDAPRLLGDASLAADRAKFLVQAPAIGSEAFLANEWDEPQRIVNLISSVDDAQKAFVQAEGVATAEGISRQWAGAIEYLPTLDSRFMVGGELKKLSDVHRKLQRIEQDLARLAQLLSESRPLSLESAIRLTAIAERATTIPEIERDALVARIWDRGVDSVQEIVEAVESVQAAKASLSPVFRESAWSKDLEEARTHLAMRGGSWLRFLSGDWRRSNRLVRSQLISPKLPADQMLASLDVLLDAQGAKGKLSDLNAQALEAFGASWQGERSSTPFLRSVVDWMRTLRPFGSGVRQRLADLPDRILAAEVAKRLRPVLEEIQADLGPIHNALIIAQREPWGDETVLQRVPLDTLRSRILPWHLAYEQCHALKNFDGLSLEAALQAIETIRQAQAAKTTLDEAAPSGKRAFGPLWEGRDSDVSHLKRAADWVFRHSDLRQLASRIATPEAHLARAEGLVKSARALEGDLQELFTTLQFEGSADVGARPATSPVESLANLLTRWEEDPEGLPQWVSYVARAKQAKGKGLTALVEGLATGTLSTDEAIGTFDLAYYETVLAEMVRRDPELSTFDGQQQTQLVESFADLDRERMRLARIEAIKTHHSRIPQRGGAAGPTAVLAREMERRRGHMAIRQLMQRCGPAIQALKPVFMMSPLSVAQFLPPDALSFDMLVVDEASQVQPVDALGAIARAKQLVIVGDERQLPPTRFFSRMLGDVADNDDDGAQAADVESILGLCRAQGLPERMLRWHYRSRHQSLIAVSNSQFYENKLFIVPSPYTSEAGVGLRFHHLPEAIYDRGKTASNPKEARAVALAVIEHAKSVPNLSLGVATFSTQQRRAIVDELELLRRQHPETEGFFSGRPDEPFFVKSLENIQGDEREVILISVGYGRDINGQVTMNFGPVSREGGERRLNVLISRAKSRCEIFSSITDEDIDLERGRGKGTAALKLFLRYARTGQLYIAESDRSKTKSVFMEEVATALRSRGYDLHTDVGIAGFFVDIAIADPDKPGRYILGIECDGESYRDARSARDRDRLRESALRDKGWQVYRIWSTDWFRRPQAELDKLTAAIEAAKLEPSPFADEQAARRRPVPIDIQTVDRGEFVEVGLVSVEDADPAEPYEEANFLVPRSQYELHLVPVGRMSSIVQQVVEIEGPVHRAEVVARVRSMWGLQRSGGRIQGAVEAGIEAAIAQASIAAVDGDFVTIPGRKAKVRDRSNVASLSLRRPDYLPPSEIDQALLDIVTENLGATTDELVLFVSRRLGYRSTSAQLRAGIEDRVAALVDSKKFASNGSMITLP